MPMWAHTPDDDHLQWALSGHVILRSNTCLWVRFRVMVLLAPRDWALWGNLTSRRDYWMFYSGRNSERVGTRSDFNGNLTQGTIGIWSHDYHCLEGGQRLFRCEHTPWTLRPLQLPPAWLIHFGRFTLADSLVNCNDVP